MNGKQFVTVDELKSQWVRDPIWDIEDTEGFEDYHDELLAFRLKKEAEWGAARREQLLLKAEKVGMPGNITLARYVEWLEKRIGALENVK